MSVHVILLIIAVILFVLSGLNVPVKFNLMAWGLAFGFAAFLI